MAFLQNFKNRMAKKKETDNASPSPAAQNAQVDLNPKGEKVTRLNKTIIFGVTGLLVVGALWLITSPPGSDPVPKKKETAENKTVQQEFLTDKRIAEANEKVKNPGGKKIPADVKNPDGKNVVVKSQRAESANDDNSSETRSAGNSSSAKRELTPEEEWDRDIQSARHKRAMKEEETAYNEDRASRKSDIFFNLNEGGRTGKAETSAASPANDYYNSISGDGGDADYIQVVGSSGKRR